MNLKSFAMASASLTLIAAPVAASAAPANPASSLSVAKSVRTSSSAAKSNKAIGGSTIPLIIGAGIIAGVAYLIIDNENEDDVPDSN